MDKIAIIETWTETEKGWGTRQDGCSVHLTREDLDAYIEDYWSKQPDETPDEYSKPDRNLKVVHISDEFYEEVKKSSGGLRLGTKINTLVEEGKIELI